LKGVGKSEGSRVEKRREEKKGRSFTDFQGRRGRTRSRNAKKTEQESSLSRSGGKVGRSPLVERERGNKRHYYDFGSPRQEIVWILPYQ
jgi:hypothetical protein